MSDFLPAKYCDTEGCRVKMNTGDFCINCTLDTLRAQVKELEGEVSSLAITNQQWANITEKAEAEVGRLIATANEQTANCDAQYDRAEQAEAKAEAMQKVVVRLYTQGYMRGHDDTVEGCFTSILPIDEDTYFKEDVEQALKEDTDDEHL